MTKVMTTPTIVRIHALVRNLPAPTEVMRQRIPRQPRGARQRFDNLVERLACHKNHQELPYPLIPGMPVVRVAGFITSSSG